MERPFTRASIRPAGPFRGGALLGSAGALAGVLSCAEVSDPPTESGRGDRDPNLPPVGSVDPSAFEVRPLEIGADLYLDQTYEISDVPPSLSSGWIIRTAQEECFSDADTFLTLGLCDSAYVAVAYDHRATASPSWLEAWHGLGAELRTTDAGASPMPIRFRAFPPGTIILGGNLSGGGAGAQSMYVPIVAPFSAQTADLRRFRSVRVIPPSARLEPGQTLQFIAEVRDVFDAGVDADVTWAATGGTIDDDGWFTAGPEIGAYWVAASVGAGSDTAEVVIAEPERVVFAVRVTPSSAALETGGTQAFAAEAFDQFGEPIDGGFTWSATGGTIEPDGVYTAGDLAGEFIVTATETSGVSGSAAVTITERAVVTEVRLTPSSATLDPGERQQFTAEAYDDFGNPVDGRFTWTATGGSVTDDGLYTAGDVPGTFTVVAEEESGVWESAQVTIREVIPPRGSPRSPADPRR
jgi:hypothetical protein